MQHYDPPPILPRPPVYQPTPSTSTAIFPAAPESTTTEALRILARARTNVRDCVSSAQAADGSGGAQGKETVLKSCEKCRKLKVRCQGTGSGTCPRCAEKGIECVYPEQRKLGRKVTSKKTLKLLEIQQDLNRLQRLLQPTPAALPPPPSGPSARTNHPGANHPIYAPSSSMTDDGSSPASIKSEEEENDELRSLLINPLSVLSFAATEDSPSPAEQPDQFTPSSLFDHVLDSDPALDPVNVGIITEGEFERLLIYYFENMQSYLFILDPALHTPLFLRRTSPFLTTVIALIAAPYDPATIHLVSTLEAHAMSLSARAFSNGYKSVEVCLAYCLWTPWASVPADLKHDRVWAHVGQAIRLAAEIRLTQPLNPRIIDEYRRVLRPFPVAVDLLEMVRKSTYELIFCLDVALSSQTGRPHGMPFSSAPASSVMRHPLPRRSPAALPDIADLHAANLAITFYFVKALFLHNKLRAEGTGPGLRRVFNSTWKSDFEQWDRNFAGIQGLPYVSRLNRHILLLSHSLAYEGPAQQVLEECQQVAVQAATYVCEWFRTDEKLRYASNFVIVNIAYSACFLVRQFSPQVPTELSQPRLDLCWKVVEALTAIGAARLNGHSVATLYADRLRSLLIQIQHRPPVLPPPPPAQPAALPVPPASSSFPSFLLDSAPAALPPAPSPAPIPALDTATAAATDLTDDPFLRALAGIGSTAGIGVGMNVGGMDVGMSWSDVHNSTVAPDWLAQEPMFSQDMFSWFPPPLGGEGWTGEGQGQEHQSEQR
ncbi:hypothetical protein JCM10207_007513 [Rhodosporidiobolus poonsookiae]